MTTHPQPQPDPSPPSLTPTPPTQSPSASQNLTPEARYELITRGLQEVLGGDAIRAILEQGKHPKCYWGTACTGRPHIGYFVPLVKIADFLRAGVEVTILLADLHAFLDNLKAPIELVAQRTKYYRHILLSVLTSLSIPTSKLHFIEGSSYQLSKQYTMDVYRLASLCSEHDAKKAGAEVVKQVDNPLLSGLLYPGLQALDEQYLECDFQFGGVDQRKIFTFAELYLPRLGYRKRSHLMNAMVPGLAGGKMSSSDPNSKIDFLDPPATIRKKIKAAFCEPGNVVENGLLAFVRAVVVPISVMRMEGEEGRDTNADTDTNTNTDSHPHPQSPNPFIRPGAPKGTLFSVPRPEKYGGTVHYQTYEALEADFREEVIHPGDLKGAVGDAIVGLLEPVRRAFEGDAEWQEVMALAYPEPGSGKGAGGGKKKKEKKQQNRPQQPTGTGTGTGDAPDVSSSPAPSSAPAPVPAPAPTPAADADVVSAPPQPQPQPQTIEAVKASVSSTEHNEVVEAST